MSFRQKISDSALKTVQTGPGPHQGKTYSLFANHEDSRQYYEDVGTALNDLLDSFEGPADLLNRLQKKSSGLLHRHILTEDQKIIAQCLSPNLSCYLADIHGHLSTLPFRRRFNSTLSTPAERYLLLMIEIELLNRLNKMSFFAADMKLAFLPHCLRDLSRTCKSTPDEAGIDYICRRCSKSCYIRKVTDLLRERGIRPYIWREARLQKLFRRVNSGGKKLAVFGMACLPELVRGMRLCQRMDIPVLGIPINANRCVRWWGRFYENSVDLPALSKLLADQRS